MQTDAAVVDKGKQRDAGEWVLAAPPLCCGQMTGMAAGEGTVLGMEAADSGEWHSEPLTLTVGPLPVNVIGPVQLAHTPMCSASGVSALPPPHRKIR